MTGQESRITEDNNFNITSSAWSGAVVICSLIVFHFILPTVCIKNQYLFVVVSSYNQV